MIIKRLMKFVITVSFSAVFMVACSSDPGTMPDPGTKSDLGTKPDRSKGLALKKTSGKVVQIDILDKDLFKDALSGGNAWQRSTLKILMTKDQRSIAKVNGIEDFHEYQPVLESLKMRGFKGAIGKPISSINPTNLELDQPYRETNGVLIFPILILDKNWSEMLSRANKTSLEKQCPIYLVLDERDLHRGASKESLSQEILKLGGRMASIDEVCTEFDTEYENIST